MDDLPATNRYVHPRPGWIGRRFGAIANSARLCAIRRAVTSRLPFAALASDVTDVIYMTWMVTKERAAPFVPGGLQLCGKGELTPFPILTYRHGHFGLAALGPARALCPSPLQSNWRLYLEASPAPCPQLPTVLFIRNVMDSTLYALGTRTLSDVLSTHRADSFTLAATPAGFGLDMRPGSGSGPELAACFTRHTARDLPPGFNLGYPTWADAVAFLTMQDGAIAAAPTTSRLAFAAISLPIDQASINPLVLTDGSLRCPFVEALHPCSEPLCFHLPRVKFRVLSEFLL